VTLGNILPVVTDWCLVFSKKKIFVCFRKVGVMEWMVLKCVVVWSVLWNQR
jgi:hypothetical protein